jgi:hypothetical protein
MGSHMPSFENPFRKIEREKTRIRVAFRTNENWSIVANLICLQQNFTSVLKFRAESSFGQKEMKWSRISTKLKRSKLKNRPFWG